MIICSCKTFQHTRLPALRQIEATAQALAGGAGGFAEAGNLPMTKINFCSVCPRVFSETAVSCTTNWSPVIDLGQINHQQPVFLS